MSAEYRDPRARSAFDLSWPIRHRGLVLVILCLLTACFAFQALKVRVGTRFNDFLPLHDPYVQEYLRHPKFSNPMVVTILIHTKAGTVFDRATLEVIQRITRDVDLIPGVDHDQIFSIASRRATFVQIVPGGILISPLMPVVPTSAAGIQDLRARAYQSPLIAGQLLSADAHDTLIKVGFVPRLMDYSVVFDKVESIVNEERDAEHEITATGQPILVGWVLHYQNQTYMILGLSLLLACLFLALYMGNVVGLVAPLAAVFSTTIWGLGILGILGFNLEPLTVVIPVLLAARAMSHSIQATERYYEFYGEDRDRIAAAIRSLKSLFAPGTLGIMTDVIGLAFLALAPIPALEKVALFCSLWVLTLIPLDVVLTPVILSYLPVPASLDALVGLRTPGPITAALYKLLRGFAAVASGITKWATMGVVVLGIAVATPIALAVRVGSVEPGSPILYPSSPYNRALTEISKNLAGSENLQIIVAGKENDAIRSPEVLDSMLMFEERMLRQDPNARAAYSMADSAVATMAAVSGGYPKEAYIPKDPRLCASLVYQSLSGRTAGELEDFVDYPDFRSTKIDVFFRDRTIGTIESALTTASQLVATLNHHLNGASLQLASGTIALQAATNRAVESSQIKILLAVSAVIFLACAVTYRSISAGLLLLVPINMANLFGVLLISLVGVALDVDTVPVLSIGMGIGIDYGIYLLTRICEEYDATHTYETATFVALQTTGKAVLMTGSVVLFAILPWYFMSDLRFQAEMGLLMCVIVLADMLLCLIMIPLLVNVFQPRFVRTHAARSSPAEIVEEAPLAQLRS
jgi:uncharacterized protein